MRHHTGSKIAAIRTHLVRGNSITPLHAIGLYAVYRLAADINRLRNDLPIITTIRVAPTGSKYAQYQLPFVGMKLRNRDYAERGVGSVVRVRSDAFGDTVFTVEYPNGAYSSYSAATAGPLEGV